MKSLVWVVQYDAVHAPGAAGTAIARPMKVIDGLPEPCCAAGIAGAFGNSGLVGRNIASGPMVPFAARRIRVVTEQRETSRCRRYAAPMQRRERSSPSQLKRRGIAEPVENPSELSCIDRPPRKSRLSQSCGGLIDPDQGRLAVRCASRAASPLGSKMFLDGPGRLT